MKENTNEILVNKVEGSIVSDNVVNSTLDLANKLAVATEKLGISKGNINSLQNKVCQLQEELQEAKESKKTVEVVIKKSDSTTQPRGIYSDPWCPSFSTNNESYIHSIKSLSGDDLTVLVNNAVKDEADQLVKAADEDIQKANRAKERAEKELKDYKAWMEKEAKKTDDKIDSAIKRHEKANLDTIAKQKAEILKFEKQIEVTNRDQALLDQQHSLIVETLNIQITGLEKQIEMLSMTASNIFEKVRNKFTSWLTNRSLFSITA